MFLQQMQFQAKQGEPIKSLEDGEKHALFQSFLAGSLTAGMFTNEQDKEQEGEESKDGAIPLSFPVKFLGNQITADEEWDKDMIQMIDPDLTNDRSDITKVSEEIDQPELQVQYQSLVNIFREVQAVLEQLNREPANMKQAAPKLMQLLQEWINTANNHANQQGMEKAVASFREGGTKEHIIWKDLLQAFEKRHQLASKQQYSTNAVVTTEDITRWLSKAMEQAPVMERLAAERMYTPPSLPIARMEQYVVHINQGQNTQAQGQQLTDQIQTIIKSSNFMTAPNNGNQLVLSLRPENLGDMMVRFTQVNGEMTVKILVTTQAAKEMLETNMHQLRNMFSPQQVVVEKQDTLMQQGQETEKNMKDDQLDEQREQASNDASEEEKQSSDGDFAEQFQALLMNEEV
jgi:flagellar hook-length control protein FliK